MISYFNKISVRRCHRISVDQLCKKLEDSKLKETCEQIEQAVLSWDEKQAQKMKADLPAVVWSELYAEFSPRKQGTGEPTGFFLIEYDYCEDEEQLKTLVNQVKNLKEGTMNDVIAAAHVSPRRHGVHIICRWLPDCHSIADCQQKFSEMANLPNYDESCKDSSRCSFLVDMSRFFVLDNNSSLKIQDMA